MLLLHKTGVAVIVVLLACLTVNPIDISFPAIGAGDFHSPAISCLFQIGVDPYGWNKVGSVTKAGYSSPCAGNR